MAPPNQFPYLLAFSASKSGERQQDLHLPVGVTKFHVRRRHAANCLTPIAGKALDYALARGGCHSYRGSASMLGSDPRARPVLVPLNRSLNLLIRACSSLSG